MCTDEQYAGFLEEFTEILNEQNLGFVAIGLFSNRKSLQSTHLCWRSILFIESPKPTVCVLQGMGVAYIVDMYMYHDMVPQFGCELACLPGTVYHCHVHCTCMCVCTYMLPRFTIAEIS